MATADSSSELPLLLTESSLLLPAASSVAAAAVATDDDVAGKADECPLEVEVEGLL